MPLPLVLITVLTVLSDVPEFVKLETMPLPLVVCVPLVLTLIVPLALIV